MITLLDKDKEVKRMKGVAHLISKAKLIRIQQGVKLCEFARRIGIHETTLSNFEHGRWALPKKWWIPVSELLNCTPEEILDDEGLAIK